MINPPHSRRFAMVAGGRISRSVWAARDFSSASKLDTTIAGVTQRYYRVMIITVAAAPSHSSSPANHGAGLPPSPDELRSQTTDLPMNLTIVAADVRRRRCRWCKEIRLLTSAATVLGFKAQT